MNAGLNLGDFIFQLFALGVPILFIIILFSYWRYSKKKKEQLNRIEEKLNSIQKRN